MYMYALGGVWVNEMMKFCVDWTVGRRNCFFLVDLVICNSCRKVVNVGMYSFGGIVFCFFLIKS
jgi:hypothetical protein